MFRGNDFLATMFGLSYQLLSFHYVCWLLAQLLGAWFEGHDGLKRSSPSF